MADITEKDLDKMVDTILGDVTAIPQIGEIPTDVGGSQGQLLKRLREAADRAKGGQGLPR